MAFQLNHFLAGAAQTASGYMAGQQQAEQHNDQLGEQMLQTVLQARQVQQQEADRQQRVQEQGLNMALGVLPMLDESSPFHSQISAQIMRGLQGMGQAPSVPAPDFSSPLIQGYARRRGLNLGSLYPSTPPVASSSPAANGATTALPGDGNPASATPDAAAGPTASPFISPRTHQELEQQYAEGIAPYVRALTDPHNPIKDPAIRAKYEQAIAALRAGQAARKPIGSLGLGPAGLGAYAPPALDPKDVTEARRRLDAAKATLVKAAQGLPADSPYRQGIAAFMGTLPGKFDTPEDLDAVNQWVRDAAQHSLTVAPAITAAAAKGEADRRKTIEDQDLKLRKEIDAAAKSGNAPRFLAAIDAQHAYVARQPSTYGLEPYEEEKLGRKSRSVPVGAPQPGPAETGPDTGTEAGRNFQQALADSVPTSRPELPAETEIRRLTNTAAYLEDPKQKEKTLRVALGKLMGVFQSSRWDTLSDEDKGSLVDQAGAMARQLGIPSPFVGTPLAAKIPPAKLRELQIQQQNANTNSARQGETAAHNQAMEDLRTKASGGSVSPKWTPGQTFQSRLILRDYDALAKEAASIKRSIATKGYVPDEMKARLDEINRPGGLLDRQRQKASDFIQQNAAQTGGATNRPAPTFGPDRSKVLAEIERARVYAARHKLPFGQHEVNAISAAARAKLGAAR